MLTIDCTPPVGVTAQPAPDDGKVEVMTLGHLRACLHDWRIPAPNYIHLHGRADRVVEVVWGTRNGLHAYVYGIRPLTHD